MEEGFHELEWRDQLGVTFVAHCPYSHLYFALLLLHILGVGDSCCCEGAQNDHSMWGLQPLNPAS